MIVSNLNQPNLNQNAFSLLTATRGNPSSPTGYERFPEASYTEYRSLSPRKLLEQFGETYTNYLNYYLHCEKARNSLNVVTQDNGMNQLALAYPIQASKLAAYCMGVREAKELVAACQVLAASRGEPVQQVTVLSVGARDVHTFLIYGLDYSLNILPKSTLEDLMQSLPETAWIIDPFLGITFPVSRFDQSELAAYCKKCGYEQVKSSLSFELGETLEELEDMERHYQHPIVDDQRFLQLTKSLEDRIQEIDFPVADLQNSNQKRAEMIYKEAEQIHQLAQSLFEDPVLNQNELTKTISAVLCGVQLDTLRKEEETQKSN